MGQIKVKEAKGSLKKPVQIQTNSVLFVPFFKTSRSNPSSCLLSRELKVLKAQADAMASFNVMVPMAAVPEVVDEVAAEMADKPQSPTVNSSTSSPVKQHLPRGQLVIQPPPPRQLGQQPVQVAQPLLVTVTSPPSSSAVVVPTAATSAAPAPPIVYSNAPSTFSISLPVHPIPFGQLGQQGQVGPPPGRVLAQVGNAPVQQVLLDQPGGRPGQWGAPVSVVGAGVQGGN